MPAKRFECFAAHNMGGMWCSSGKSEIRISKSETIQQIRISNYQIDLYEVGVGVFRSGDLFCRRFLAVGAVQVEINAAQRTLAFGFAQNDRDVLVQRDAVAQARRATLVRVDCLGHQRLQTLEKFVGRLFDADHEFLVVFQ